MRLHRLISILLLIESKGMIKAKEIAEKLEISLRTVYRDIDSLCEAGIPVAASTGPNGGIYLMDGYTGGISHLQEEDIISLYINGMGIIPDKQSDMAIKLNNALLKLQKKLSPKQISEIDKVKSKFYFDDTLWWGEKRRLPFIDSILYGVIRSKGLSIKYIKHGGELSARMAQPYGIVVKNTDWYLIAYCENSKEVRTFKCDRIIECSIMESSFNVPSGFSIEEYWKKNETAFKRQCKERERYPVLIRLEKLMTHILSNLEVIDYKEKGNYIEALINMHGYKFAMKEAMNIIGYAEIVEPAELRDYTKNALYTIISRYEL
ncbi:MAG: helix-turn-helix transcriptional regulator [Bacillota bacterium]